MVALGAIAAALALAGCGSDEADTASAVIVRSDNQEKGDRVLGSQRIRVTPKGLWTPVYRVEVEDLKAGERVFAGVEIQVTHCTASDLTKSSSSSCKGTAPYTFNPTVDTKLVLATRGPGGKLEPGGTPMGKTSHRKCTKKLHHCVPVQVGQTAIGSQDTGDHLVVLMVRARNPEAKPCKPARPVRCNVLQLSHDEGRMGVVRESGRGLNPKMFTAERERVRALRLAKTKPQKKSYERVLYSIELDKPGPVLLRGSLIAKFAPAYPTPPLVNKQLILADSPTATSGATVEPQNGENCHGTCRYLQPGLLPCLTQADLDAGNRFLNLVVFSSRAAAYAKPNHRVRITHGGSLAARQYDAALAPKVCAGSK